MRIAPEGMPFVAGFLIVGGAIALAAAVLAGTGPALALVAGSPLFMLGLFSVWFFRDPERVVPQGADVVVAPADGRVVARMDDPEGPALAIFLSVFDVHVNRAPVAGRVERVAYRRGRFLAAYDDRAGELNEQNEIVIMGDSGPVCVRQIAGLIARRIVCRVRPGDTLEAGQRFGMIRFGSRTDLRLPPGATLLVKPGDRVRGGETVVGRLAGAERRADAEADSPRASREPGRDLRPARAASSGGRG